MNCNELAIGELIVEVHRIKEGKAMSGSMEWEDVTELAQSTGLTEHEIREIIEMVGPTRSSIIREATILKRSLERAADGRQFKPH